VRILVVVVALLTAGMSSFLAFRYSQDTYNAQDGLNQERYLRMIAEEDIEKATQQIKKLSLAGELHQDKIKGMELLLEQTKMTNTDLQNKFDQVVVKNNALKAKIKALEQTAAKIAAKTAAGGI